MNHPHRFLYNMTTVFVMACSALSETPTKKAAETTFDTGVSAKINNTPISTDVPSTPTQAEKASPNMNQGIKIPPLPPKNRYPWLKTDVVDTIARRFSPPPGFHRTQETKDSFAHWLRNLPLLLGKPNVLLFNGNEKNNQDAHEAVVDIDVGNRNLQQCADAVMRLRAEYLRIAKKENAICFRFTNGSDAVWRKWQSGYRPKIAGRKVSWNQQANPTDEYGAFRKYLTKVFQYAGTASLEKELPLVKEGTPVAAGNVFIEGGFPGHAVIVVDVAENAQGERLFLLVQSYMPAQQMHILRNPKDSSMSPWYRYDQGADLSTPEWHFKSGTLRRFSNRRCSRPDHIFESHVSDE